MKKLKTLLLVVFVMIFLVDPHKVMGSQEAHSYIIFEIQIRVDNVVDAARVIDTLPGQNTFSRAHTWERGQRREIIRQVPLAQYYTVVESLRELGYINFERERSTNLDAEATDLQARIRSNATEIERLTSLMLGSANLDVLIEVESRLSEAQRNRDALLGSFNQIVSTTAVAEVHIDIRETVGIDSAIDEDQIPFATRVADSFMDSASNFANFLGDITIALTNISVPLLVLGVPSAFIGHRFWRRKKSKLPVNNTSNNISETEDDSHEEN